jgi:DNA topoisomerase IA
LTTDAFRIPKSGKTDDQSHPPIHPTKYATDLNDKQKAIYELIVRHFLASCSDDAHGRETTVRSLISFLCTKHTHKTQNTKHTHSFSLSLTHLFGVFFSDFFY